MTENSTILETVELTSRDFQKASVLLAEAFFDNPSHVYIFSDPSTRLKALQWGLKTYLMLNLSQPNPVGKSFALVEADKSPGIRQIKAMAFWTPPDSKSISLIAKIKTGWITIPFRYGWQTYQRITKVMSEIDLIKEEVLGNRQAWYLNNMAVATEFRGTGVGTKLLRKQLQTVIIPSDFPAILMTQKQKNVRFYQRLGFEIADKSEIGEGKNKFTSWCLVYD